MTGPLVEDSAAGDPINRSRLLVFKLKGSATLPEATEKRRNLPTLKATNSAPAVLDQGFSIYDRYCVNCHGAGAIGGGVIPDLRYSAITASKEVWREVVFNGILSEQGMVSFSKELSEDDIETIRHYVISRNQFAHSIGDTQRLSR